jgi:hypothetical protein
MIHTINGIDYPEGMVQNMANIFPKLKVERSWPSGQLIKNNTSQKKIGRSLKK